MRFDYNMNLLQLCCHEEAILILQWLTVKLRDQEKLKTAMTEHRDSKVGSRAIHLAATTGNAHIIKILCKDYKAEIDALTLGGQNAIHCAA